MTGSTGDGYNFAKNLGHTITELKPQVKIIKRVSLYLNGSYYCVLDLLTVMQARLKVGQEIDENTLIEIQRNSEASACFDSALNFISKSVKTEKEIKDKLLLKGYLEEIVLEASKLLKYGGDFYIVNKEERLVDMLSGLRKNKLEPKELVVLSSKSGANAVMIKAKKGGKSGIKITLK